MPHVACSWRKGDFRDSQCIMRERPRKYLVEQLRTVGRQKEARKSYERMALYLEGKTPLDANDLSPKEATE